MSTLATVIQKGVASALPTASIAGRLYFTTDTLQIFYDTGTIWVNVTPAGGAGLTNPMTTVGDLIVAGSAGTPTRLAAGPNGDVLTLAGGVPTWAVPTGGGGGAPSGAAGGDLGGTYPNPTALKTSGVAFAPSATTDTTNAANIGSGTLPVARLPIATTAAYGAVKPDGTTVTISGGLLSAIGAAPSGVAGGDLSGSFPNPTVAKVGGVTPGNIVSHNVAEFDAAGAATAAQTAAQAFATTADTAVLAKTINGKALSTNPVLVASDVNADPAGAATTAQVAAVGSSLQKTANLSDLASPSAARTSLGLGSAAVLASTAFDAAGAATAAQAAAIAAAANASNLSSGTVPVAVLPVATTAALGAVKPDGTTITITAGVISGPTPLSKGLNVFPTGLVNGINLAYTLPNPPNPPADLKLFMGGMLMVQGVDYTLSAAAITYITSAPTTGSTHTAFYTY